ncbi:hypothetical protein Presley_23 [Acinetobacter phage Presley]|uniref:Uncharacterized protein n=1 Tax=Acinetobacter phage Presley TaxID=1406780 RepID=U5PVS3_9CAUD|nr:hypothetical protein Presley_23 [Acinetobacter phage Presley]AGY48090.1 hypothetical protein Presley_23 [Acinetobacter phage Presley]
MSKVQIVLLKFFRNIDTDIYAFASSLGIHLTDCRGQIRGSKTRYQLFFIIIDGSIKAYLTPLDKDPKDYLNEGRQYTFTEPVVLPGSRRSLDNFPAKLTLLGIQVNWSHGKNNITRASYSS